MAALSAFMSNNESISKKVIDYAEESITTYLNSCRMQQFATRATILSVECLKGKGLYGEAANQLIRMTSEDSDLRSAVLLEQAAYCFLHSQRPTMHRKYSFHMVFAGHRYSKAGHKHHSIRCYSQAYQVYENKCWSVAEDHINFTVGKQSSQLKLATNAVEAFSRLVTRSSRQSATQQQLFLKEYITTVQQLESDFGELKILAIPVIEYFSIQVLLGHPSSRGLSPNIINATGINFDNPNDHQNRSLDEGRWGKLEEKLVTFVQGMNTMVFKPTVELFTNKTNNSSSPVVVLGELVSLNIGLKNPLHIPIKLHNLHLSWSVIPEEGGMCQDNSQGSKAAVTDPISEITIEPESTRYVRYYFTINMPVYFPILQFLQIIYLVITEQFSNTLSYTVRYGSIRYLIHVLS
ncbi:hypothetical protein AAG570_012716 [Ranatra chinensis]|uniref:TPPC8 first Ig-like domain-containing protein n=1 Tax=Ranatra chinensis TaxID=642074 RepID=A0ABD0YTC3_9HEMI